MENYSEEFDNKKTTYSVFLPSCRNIENYSAVEQNCRKKTSFC